MRALNYIQVLLFDKMGLPCDVVCIIHNYLAQLEHVAKWDFVMCELRYKHFFKQVCELYTHFYNFQLP